jgi:hypothetical protein
MAYGHKDWCNHPGSSCTCEQTLDKILKEIRERAEAATEGPWDRHLTKDITPDFREYGGPSGYVVTENLTLQSYEQRDINRRFCAHSRTDVPMLLEMVITLHRAVLEQDLPKIMQKYKFTEDVDKDLEKIAEKYK